MKRVIAFLVLGELFSTGVAIAQLPQVPAPQQNASPIELAAQPERMAPGTSVTINGTVARQGSAPLVITVKPPTGAPFSQTASPDASGAFAIQDSDTKTSGTYQVLAQLGANSTTTKFEVGMADIAQKTIQQAQQILQTADLLVRQGRRQHANNPTSNTSGSAEINKEIARLQEDIADAKKLWTPSDPGSVTTASPPTFADVLLDVTGQIQKSPDVAPRFAANLNQLLSWSEKTDQILKRLKSREPMLKSTQVATWRGGGIVTNVSFSVLEAAELEGSADTCKNAKKTAEFFEFAGSVLSLLGGPLTVGLNLAAQVYGTQNGSPTGIPVVEHLAVGAVEAAEWKHELNDISNPISLDGPTLANMPVGMKITAGAVASHLAAAVADGYLGQICGEWKGPFHATMHAEAENDRKPWWKYTVEIDGNLTLLFRKSDWDNNGKVPFTGEFEGSGTNFTVWEESLPVLYPKLFRPGFTISYHKVTATAVTNLSFCLRCVSPLRAVAVDSEDPWKEDDPYFTSHGGEAMAGFPSLGVPFPLQGETPGPNGVSGQPTNIGVELFPGFKSLANWSIFSAAYFQVPVEGEIETDVNGDRSNYQGNVSLTVLQARNDWDPELINAHVRYLVVTSGLGLGVPLLLDFGLPYKSAEFILKRALGNNIPGPATDDYRVRMKVSPGTTGTGEDFSSLRIEFQNTNDMPKRQVENAPSQTGKADYSINLEILKQAEEPPPGSTIH